MADIMLGFSNLRKKTGCSDAPSMRKTSNQGKTQYLFSRERLFIVYPEFTDIFSSLVDAAIDYILYYGLAFLGYIGPNSRVRFNERG